LLCPAEQTGAPINSGGGSNGKFDYQMMGGLSGAKLTRIPAQARPWLGQWLSGSTVANSNLVSTPMIIETMCTPNYTGSASLQTAAELNQPTGKTSWEQLAQGISVVHPDGGYIVGIDGSVFSYLYIHGEADIYGQAWEVLNDGHVNVPYQTLEIYASYGWGKI
jgi:hypothetical protein